MDASIQPSGPGYALPWVPRILCLGVGICVAYSQFVSVAFLFLCRTQDAWVPGRGYVTNSGLMAKFLVVSIFHDGGEIIYLRYPPWLTVPIGAALAVLGSAGLFAAGRARHPWSQQQKWLLRHSVAGMVVAGVVFNVNFFEGASRLNRFGFEITNFYFLHGRVEFFGATALPAAAYAVLILTMLVAAIGERVFAKRDRSARSSKPPP